MTGALDAVRAELASLRPQIYRLEYAELLLDPSRQPPATLDLVASQDGEMDARSKRAERRPAKRSLASAAAGPTRTPLREYLRAHAPATRSEMIEAFGASPKAIDGKLRRMRAVGEVTAVGPRGRQRYSLADSPVNMATLETFISSPIPERGVYPSYDVIVDLHGATTAQISSRTKRPSNLVYEECRRLLQLGLVRITGAGLTRRWLATQPQPRRDRT